MNQFNFFQWVKYILENHWSNFVQGIGITLYISLIGTIVGFIIGLLLSLIRTKQEVKNRNVRNIFVKILQRLIDFYIAIFRGTPMIVQAIIFYYGLSQLLGINMSPINSALVIVSINTGSYISEIIRGGIQSIDKGQYEACVTLGMTHNQSMINVILPQVVKNILPAISNEFIINIKDTSVLFAIGVTELFTMSRSIAGTYSRYYEVFIITSVIYFILTFGLAKILKKVEIYLEGPEHYEIVEGKNE